MADEKLEMVGIVLECRRGDVYEVEATIGALRRRVLARARAESRTRATSWSSTSSRRSAGRRRRACAG